MIVSPKACDAIELKVERMCALLSEMGCDSVRIFTTAPVKGGETASITAGAGNIYAQLGSVRDWGVRQDEYTRADARRDTDE